ncbi:16S rRNA (cytosine(1402)-N(4))-methyltransferase [Candidatus Peregrinibacteria bacterium CG_4_10_14_3_um_filter_44_21]|nr:MAG: 16S rRNA (cytosine(1402)-N(4))-methyltransferase [Candidatus Peregrinibacteria bacterium CG_4_10_14_3_um_filter_44_21]
MHTENKKKMHIPVLKEEVLDSLKLKPGYKVVDATLGLGGHALEMLELIGEKGHLYAFDQDERNLLEAKKNLADYEDRITYYHFNFVSLKTCLTDDGVTSVDAALFDLGLSSPHVDDPSRGFAFKADGPLDMRYDVRQKLKASDIVNKWSESDLVEIFSKYGEERASKKVAREIVNARKNRPFETTEQLADFIREQKKHIREKKDAATNVFQALRIAVNDELDVLAKVLPDAISVLKPGGRIAVISYHSIEDRIVKNVFRDLSKDLEDPDEHFVNKVLRAKQIDLLTKKPIIPSESEISENPRARSAKLRVAQKV